MDGDDRGSGAEIGVADQSVELSSGFDQSGVDLGQSLVLLGGVSVSMAAQGEGSFLIRGLAVGRSLRLHSESA